MFFSKAFLALAEEISRTFFSNQIALYHGDTQGVNSEIQNAVFSKRNTSRNSKLKK